LPNLFHPSPLDFVSFDEHDVGTKGADLVPISPQSYGASSARAGW